MSRNGSVTIERRQPILGKEKVSYAPMTKRAVLQTVNHYFNDERATKIVIELKKE